MPRVIHSVVEPTNYEDARFVDLQEHAVAATGRHAEPGSEVITIAANDSPCREPLHDVPQFRFLSHRAIGAPGFLRIASYRPEILPSDLGKIEAPHRSAKKASIWSSFSSRITLP